MDCALLRLPVEIFDLIVEHLKDGRIIDLRKLSGTCTDLRYRLVPHIFENLSFTSDKQDADRALTAARAHGEHVRSLSITLMRPAMHEAQGFSSSYDIEVVGGAKCMENEQSAKRTVADKRVICPAVRTLLSGILTPHASAYTVEFQYSSCSGCKKEHAGLTLDPEVQYEYRQSLWWVRLESLWFIIMQNRRVRHLTLVSLLGRDIHAARLPAWRTFMQQLDRLSFSLPRCVECSLRYRSNAMVRPERQHVIRERFLKQVQSVRELTLIGCGYGDHCFPGSRQPTWVGSCVVPSLQTLICENFYLDKALEDFIASNGTTLKRIEMHDCEWISDANRDLSSFFPRLVGQVSALEKLVVQPGFEGSEQACVVIRDRPIAETEK